MMKQLKNRTMMISVLVGLIFTALLLTTPVLAADDSQWTWTKETPKPSWWRWDETYFPEKPKPGGYIHSAYQRDVGLQNPNHWPINNWAALSWLYDRLLYPDGQYKPTIPGLALSWKYENPTTVLMKLRKGVKFHDGAKFDAHAVKYQMEWIKDKKNGCWSATWIEPLKSVEVVDDYTIRWHFTKTWSSFLDIMANVPGWMISPKALKGDAALEAIAEFEEKMDDAEEVMDDAEGAAAKKKARAAYEKAKKAFETAEAAAEGIVSTDSRGVGTGAYMVEEAKPGNYFRVKRNPDWWFGKSIGKPDMPYFAGRQTTVIPEPSVRLANLKAGKIDWLLIQNSQLSQIENDPKLEVSKVPSNFTWFLMFNQKKGPLKDIRVRKAISHAIDRKALIAAAANGIGTPASGMLPGIHWARNPKLKPVEYNPALSRKLLAEAGYSRGLTLKGYNYTDDTAVRMGQILAAMMRAVNITYKLDALDPSSAADRFRNLEWEMIPYLQYYIKAPYTGLELYRPETLANMGRSHNKRAVTLLDAAQAEPDLVKQLKIFHELEAVLYNNYEDAWLYYPTFVYGTRKIVRGMNTEMWTKAGLDFWYVSHGRWFADGKGH